MNASIIKNSSISILKAPLIQPFRTALGDHNDLENVLFGIELSDGTKGFGEAAIATHITGETVERTFDNLKTVGTALPGHDAADYLKISSELHEGLPTNKAALAAVEMALLDALTRQWKIPLWKFFGSNPQRLTSDITIVIADLKETEEAVKKFFHQGFRIFKVKVGRDMDLDFKRILSVRKFAPRATIYLDVNQGYTAEQTLKFLKMIQKAGVRPVLVEQPVAREDWEGLKKVTRLAGVPICADESVCSLPEAIRAIREKAVDIINIKLVKTGFFESREIVWLAHRNGIKLMMGGMLETSLAMTAAAHMAAGLGCFDYIDLDTPFFVKGELEKNPCLSRRGVYNVQKVRRGIGVEIK